VLMNSSPTIDRLVLQGWRNDRRPRVEGIVFADGRIVLLQATWTAVEGAQYPERSFAYSVEKDRVTSIGARTGSKEELLTGHCTGASVRSVHGIRWKKENFIRRLAGCRCGPRRAQPGRVPGG